MPTAGSEYVDVPSRADDAKELPMPMSCRYQRVANVNERKLVELEHEKTRWQRGKRRMHRPRQATGKLGEATAIQILLTDYGVH